MALLVEVLSLVRARIALSWRFLHRTGLHALVLGGPRKEGAGLLFGSGLADAEHDVGEGIGGSGRLPKRSKRHAGTPRAKNPRRGSGQSASRQEMKNLYGTVGWARTTDLLFHRQAL